MPDYNLFGLSPRSFEQLIQALSAKIIGPDVVIFGDGPDGAREATFSGKLNYPSTQAPWDGDGIVQAKFLQRSSGNLKQDAGWLLKQLAEEMKKFSRRGSKSKKKRAVPEYYIMATNVTLSPKAESGGKDRVDVALRQYQRNLGWKAYDVWDSDKISRLLDGQRDIATTYAAWITAGDVLEAVISALKPKRSDFHDVMFTFLQKELLAAQYANLRQAGHTDQERVALSRVFVDLPVSERQWLDPPEEGKGAHAVSNFVAHLLREGSCRLSETESGRLLYGDLSRYFVKGSAFSALSKRYFVDRLSESKVELSTVEFEKLAAGLFDEEKESHNLSKHLFIGSAGIGKPGFSTWISGIGAGGPRSGRIVLLGGPGQGKTTVGQFACQVYRASILKAAERGVVREVREALRLIRQQCGQSVPVPSGRRYPLHIDLKALAAFLSRHDVNNAPSLLEFIRVRISQRVCAEVSNEDLKLWLKEYPWFIVFDGLDEVPATGNREGTMQCINEFMVDADALDADILILATCRPQSYAKEFDEKHYRHLWLVPLSEARALDYGNRLLTVRHAAGTDLETYKTRLATAAKTPATARLMRSPLQVTIMAALVERVGLPPEQRWSLFSEYYRVIYDRETERGTKWSVALRDYRTDVDLIHRHIGFLVHKQSEAAAGVETSLARIFHSRIEQRSGESVRRLEITEPNENATHRFLCHRL
ncbi:MAG: hypothetical protein KGJ88_03380 [Verrucomicrobiota bacterium]|nr:hypothetical protein [Verrucomicrobiota bacterium]